LRRSGRFKGVWGKGFERHRHGREEREGWITTDLADPPLEWAMRWILHP
jgi:hypothetical protein